MALDHLLTFKRYTLTQASIGNHGSGSSILDLKREAGDNLSQGVAN
jgi:hypothetical protein